MKRTVFISDSHGYLDEAIAVLCDLGLTDDKGKWIANDNARLVHLGDYLDRGPKSAELFRYFADLQKSLAEGQVVRLMGNHDIQYIGGPECGREGSLVDLDEEMRAQVAEGFLKTAHVFEEENDKWLCVHGGLDPAWDSLQGMPIEKAAERLNKMGQEVVAEGKHHPEVIGVNRTRGGWEKTSGVTWCDVDDDLRPMEGEITHKQIMGHRPQRDGANLSEGGKLWAVNVPYGFAQGLVHDQGSGFSASRIYTPNEGLILPPQSGPPLAKSLT